MTLLLSINFLVLGLIIGSFLNVVIARSNTGKTLGGRSACMSCQRKLHWYDLVPLFSFLSLRGRCRTCKTRISYIYPLVESVTGFLFLVLFLKFQDFFFFPARNAESIASAGGNPLSFAISYIYYAILFSILIVITAYDIRHKIIPDQFSFIFGLLAFLGLFFFQNNFQGNLVFYSWHMPSMLSLATGFLVALPFFLCWLLSSGRWMGLGDAKLALGLGWMLGLSFGLSAIALAFWIGAISGITLIIFSKIGGSRFKNFSMKSEIPFAPYLVLGAFLAFIFELNIFMIGF